MEQKFLSFEEALEKLGIGPERLNDLREAGQLRAYRDGKSWKFRSDEIEAMVADGVPELPPPSDIGLVDPSELVAAAPLDIDADDDGLNLADDDLEDDSELEGALDLGQLDDTVTAGTSDVDLDLDLSTDESDVSDSILLSEEELGGPSSGPASTIIGKTDIPSGDADLELALDEAQDLHSSSGGASDVLSSGVAGSGVLDDLKSESGNMSAFEDLEELEIDLEAESSRILSPEQAGKAKAAAGGAKQAASSDLSLDDDDLALEEEAKVGSTDAPREELEGSGSLSVQGFDIDLDLDDEVMLADAGGSDITLDSGDSGINLVSPADSGLALDDISLDMGGSAILSSLSLEGSDQDISLVGGDSAMSLQGSDPELQADDDFQLTPLSEGDLSGDGDSSSQVIALDANFDDMTADAGMVDAGVFADDDMGDDVVLSDDFAAAPAEGLPTDYAGGQVMAAAVEYPYTLGNVLLLGTCVLVLMFALILGVDLVRTIWSWREPFELNNTLIDAVNFR